MDDELSEDRVERLARERQFLCGRPDYLNARMAVASGGDEGFRRIDGCDGRSPNARDQLRGEGPGAAANVEHPMAGSHPGEVRKLRRKEARVLAHVPVVGVRGHIEAHRAESSCRPAAGGDQPTMRSG